MEQRRADKRFAEVLTEAVQTVEQAGLPFLVLGGLASALVGRPRWTHDIDLLVRPEPPAAGRRGRMLPPDFLPAGRDAGRAPDVLGAHRKHRDD